MAGVRVVIVGATGNTGRALVRALGPVPDMEVVGVARRPPAEPLDMEFRPADMANDDLTVIFRGADAVVHLGWLFQPTHRPRTTWATNVTGTARVFRAVAEASVPALVYASSVGAYSPGRGQTVDESWPTHSLPTAGYGREKAYVERLLDSFQAEHPGCRVARFRPAFVFQALSGVQQRRLFIGPLLPGWLVRPGRLPVVPWPHGLRMQAVHADDLAQAYRAALCSDVAGAFNVAAEPVLDGQAVGEVLGARPITIPAAATRAVLAAGWHARMAPAEPALLDLVLSLPLMRVDRAREVLGWQPTRSAPDALREALYGMASGSGLPGGPLAEDSPARRLAEMATGAGQRA